MLLRDLLARRVRNALLLVGIALFCLPASAFAARQSLVSLTRDVIQAGKVNAYSTYVAPGKPISLGSSTPSATIMIPANFISGRTLSIYSTPPCPVYLPAQG